MDTYVEILLLVALLIFLGECLAMLAEILSARTALRDRGHVRRQFYRMAIVIVFAGLFSLLGYTLGITVLKNIWIVSVVSIASELLLEPVLDYTLLRQLPTRGAAIGFALGAAGIIVALLLP